VKILYEDDYLMICEKPVGVSSQASESGEDMLTLLEAYRRAKGDDGYVGLVHRLDTATGGVIVYSKSKELTGKLCEAIQSAEHIKEYLAIVEGRPTEDSGEFCDLLYHDKRKNKSFVVDKKRSGVKEARATYELVDSRALEGGRVVSLVKVRLITGRTHQIRVQLASRKMQILGDGKYGSRDNRASLALWAHKIEIIHPKTRKTVGAKSLPPHEYPWNLFDL